MERRVLNRTQVLAQLRTIARSIETPFQGSFPSHAARARVLIDRIYDSQTPPFRLSIEQVRDVFLGPSGLANLVDDRAKSSVRELMVKLEGVLTERGHRCLGDILSVQEHALIASTVPSQYGDLKDAYTPMGILTGSLTPVEVRRARELRAVSQAIYTCYLISSRSSLVSNAHVYVSLEPLDVLNRTLRDPRVVQILRGTVRIVTPELLQVVDFPFSRIPTK